MPKICSIIVTYKPDLEDFIYNLERISRQTDEVLIIDNSEDFDFYNRLSKNDRFLTLKNIFYSHMPKNLGLEAINIGAEIAKERKADFILLMDHDNTPEKNMVSELLNKYNLAREFKIPVAVIGPTMIDKRTGERLKTRTKVKESIIPAIEEVDQIPTSGMFIPIKVFFDVGKFNKDLFLDVTEYEWCWRAKKKGYKILRCKAALAKHELGKTTKSFGLIKLHFHSAERHYYQFRNSIFVINCKYAPMYMRLHHFMTLMPKLLICNLYTDQKLKGIKNSFRGLKDGFKEWILHKS